ncbi:MAG TPA: carboxylating nicotinate-nucleotide diphosphorylase [Acidimicrobiales bacterium]|nr:carboxylating nicotinate-nucleotide diphosphorylase [Acidimicrobiales bacterium]
METTTRPDGAAVNVDPPSAEVERAVRLALDEDLGPVGDLTGALIDEAVVASADIVTREDGVLAGEACAVVAFRFVDLALQVEFHLHDGDRVAGGDVIATVTGSMRSIVAAERTALNFLCHLSGIATATRTLVDAVHAVNEHVAVLDTRKTTPGLRALEKAAVRAGGGTNHRSSLSDAILLKDNHLGVMSITDAVREAASRYPSTRIEVECDTEGQADEAIAAGATAVLLDNMDPDLVAECVARIRVARPETFVEASGGITVATAPAFAAAGVDAVSSGALTHSVRILDLGLDLHEG